MSLMTLEDVCIPKSIVDGPFGSNLKLSDYCESGVPVLQGKNITGNELKWFDVRFISEAKAEELKRSSVREGDVLIVKIGSIGYSALVDDLNGYDFAIIPANLARITPNPSVVDTGYLLHLLRSDNGVRYFQSVASKTAQPALSLGKIKSFAFDLPPLEEQKRIAAILDKADSLRRKRAQAIALADDFLRATFLDLFGDDFRSEKATWCTIGDATTFIDYRGKTPEKSDMGIPLLTAKNVKNGYLDVEPREFIPEENYADWMTRGFPREGDLLFTTEAPLGNVALLPKYEKVALAQRVICMQPADKFVSEYLLMALQHPEVVDQIAARATGSTVKGIRSKELIHVTLPAPNLEKQHVFKRVFQRVASIKKKYGSSEFLVEENQRSLASSFFVGTR